MTTQDLEQLGQQYVQSTGHGYGLLASREVILTAPGKDTSTAYQAGFKKALDLVLSNNMITEVHNCDTYEQLLAWLID